MINNPPLDGNDAPIVEQVAQDLIGHCGPDAAHYVREQAEIAAESGDVLTVDTWCDIAEAIDRLL
jgi:hypothetical protein